MRKLIQTAPLPQPSDARKPGVRKENRGGSPEDLAESVFQQYLFLFSFGPIFTQNQNGIVRVDESLPHLKSTSTSWAEKQIKMCPEASKPETRNYLFIFTQHEPDHFAPFLPPYFTVIFLSPRKKSMFKDVI